jgi:hypothetical protein
MTAIGVSDGEQYDFRVFASDTEGNQTNFVDNVLTLTYYQPESGGPVAP